MTADVGGVGSDLKVRVYQDLKVTLRSPAGQPGKTLRAGYVPGP